MAEDFALSQGHEIDCDDDIHFAAQANQIRSHRSVQNLFVFIGTEFKSCVSSSGRLVVSTALRHPSQIT